VTNSDIDRNKDTYDPWSVLKKSAVTEDTYNSQYLRNKWAKFKQYTLDDDSHVVSLIPLPDYLNKFQGFLDSLTNTPLEPTEIEKANTCSMELTPSDIIFPYLIMVIIQPTPPTTMSRHKSCILTN